MGNALNALRLIYAIVGIWIWIGIGRYTSERLGPRPKMRSVAYRMRCISATAEADCKIISQQHEDSSTVPSWRRRRRFFFCAKTRKTPRKTHTHSKTAYCKTRMLLCESESSPLIELFPQSAVARTLGVTG